MPVFYDLPILEKYTTTRSKGRGEYYHIVVQDWLAPHERFKITVPNVATYNIAQRGHNLRLATHAGRLGFVWIDTRQAQALPY